MLADAGIHSNTGERLFGYYACALGAAKRNVYLTDILGLTIQAVGAQDALTQVFFFDGID